ncbi:MAG: hypothetical protein P8Z00_16350 [Anaerolineales bacterium]|jgi:hypothetical protein
MSKRKSAIVERSMRSFRRSLWFLGGSITAAAGIGWLGLQVKPVNFPAPAVSGSLDEHVPVPEDLPSPILRHFNNTFGREVPLVHTAVVWGHARLKRAGLWIPARYQVYYQAGNAFYRAVQLTWFGQPVVTGHTALINDQGELIARGLVSIDEKSFEITQSQVLSMWSESLFTPSILLADSPARWLPRDEDSARLMVPFGAKEETLVWRVDPQSGWLSQTNALRWRLGTPYKVPWRVDYSTWTAYSGVYLPTRLTLAWEDSVGVYAQFDVDGAVFNVDISHTIV